MQHSATQNLAANGISLSFGGIDVLSDVDLELKGGEIHALVGENGAGKSSLAKVIAGVYAPRKGRIELDGVELALKNPRDALGHGIALIHQEPLTFPDLDITENIFAGHHPKSRAAVNWKQARRKTAEILAELGVDVDPRANAGGLSVARQQMIELAAALSHQSRFWIFDETTAPLTPKESQELFAVMRKLRDQGCALLMVTHRLEEVFAVSDRITVLRDGKKVGERTPSQTSVGEIVRLMVGRELGFERITSCGTPVAAKPLLKLRGLAGPGFHDVNLDLRAGEVVGLAGLVGAGRTELARALFGITRAASGTVEIDGAAARISSPREAQKLGIALVPEDRQHDSLFLPQSIVFNTTLPSLARLGTAGWMSRPRQIDASTRFAERLRLAHRTQNQPVLQLSGGNQQKVALSKWLMTAPKLLILDEPTRGVDIGAKGEVHKLIRAQADAGIAVLVISSDLPEILALCDRIMVMRGGQTVAEMDADSATQERIMLEAISPVRSQEEGDGDST